MTDKEISILKDKILSLLIHREKDIQNLANELSIDFDLIWTLSSEIAKDGYIRERDYSTKDRPAKGIQLTPKGKSFLNTSSYFKSFLLEGDSQKKIHRSKMIPEVIKIGLAIIFGISSVILGWINYLDNKTINEQKAKIKQLEIQIDSLKNDTN